MKLTPFSLVDSPKMYVLYTVTNVNIYVQPPTEIGIILIYEL